MLKGNKILTSLDLHDCGLGPVGLHEVCNALEVNTTLTSLDLSDSTFDDQSIASLGKLQWNMWVLCCRHWTTYA